MEWPDFFGNIDWGGVVQRAVPAAVPAVVGSVMASNANRRAAETVANANAGYANLMAQAQRESEARLGRIAEEGAPAVSYLRNVMARPPEELTPQQQNYVGDVRRRTGNQLASRLGGRSATAVATKAASDIYGNTVAANQQRADEAARTLYPRNQQAVMVNANLPLNVAGNVGAGNMRTAETIGAGQIATGQQQAESVGEIMSPKGDVINALASFMATERKRPSSYSTG